MAKRWVTAPLRGLLAFAALRRRLIFELQQHYYAELGHGIPIGRGFYCPLPFAGADESFTEIFVHGEYSGVFTQAPLPDRWIDLGCHAGYFSLYVGWLRSQAGTLNGGQALLVDADSRLELSIQKVLELNPLARDFRFAHGLIAKNDEMRVFCEREFMASALADNESSYGAIKKVPVMTAGEIVRRFPPPYDMVKVDVEGAETDFLTHYEPVWSKAKFLVMEWHASLGGGQDEILKMAEDRGFENLVLPRLATHAAGTTGLLLLRNRSLVACGDPQEFSDKNGKVA